MQRYVVTGANKGIGLAVVKRLLDTDKTAYVFLGSRDAARGKSAVETLVSEDTDSYTGRVEALEIDVSDDGSVSRAVDTVRARLSGDTQQQPGHLAALINNAGVASSDLSSFKTTVDINFHGVVRVTEAFLPLLNPSKGRVVITSSGGGPLFVAKCSAERQSAFTNPDATHEQIVAIADEGVAIALSGGDVAEKFAAAGLSGCESTAGHGFSEALVTGCESMAGYGFSKALVNLYTMQLARENPSLIVNAASPGFIVTDLARPLESQWGQGKTLEEMGAKPPSEGAKSLVYLATGEVLVSGSYFGSDCKRSPLDRYRSPGDPEYDGK